MVRALWGLGGVLADQGELQRARVLYDEGLALAQELGFKAAIAEFLNSMGEVNRLAKDYAQAAVHYAQSIQLFHALGDKESMSLALNNVGHVALNQHDIVKAAAHFAECLTLGQAQGFNRRVTDALAGLAAVAVAQGQTLSAVHLLSAVGALQKAISYQFDAADQLTYDQRHAMVRAQLDSATFEAAWAAGQMLPLDQAIAEAMEVAHTAQAATTPQPLTSDPQHPPT